MGQVYRIKKIGNCTDRELEIFVRKRLGQKEVIDKAGSILSSYGESKVEHERISFHEEDEQNEKIVKIFTDLLGWPCIIKGYKGSLYVKHCTPTKGIVETEDEFNGWGTVSIIIYLLKETASAKEINLDQEIINIVAMANKESELTLENEVEKYLLDNGWEVKRQCIRKDCVGWTHPYTCDIIARHPEYSLLGWIGFELKNRKTFLLALTQIITKYQNNYFFGISQPIHCWIIITHSNWGGYTKEESWDSSTKALCNQLGVFTFEWNKLIDPSGPFSGPYGEYAKYNKICFAGTNEYAISIDSLGIKFHKKKHPNAEQTILKLLKKRTTWSKAFNKNNIKYLEASL